MQGSPLATPEVRALLGMVLVGTQEVLPPLAIFCFRLWFCCPHQSAGLGTCLLCLHGALGVGDVAVQQWGVKDLAPKSHPMGPLGLLSETLCILTCMFWVTGTWVQSGHWAPCRWGLWLLFFSCLSKDLIQAAHPKYPNYAIQSKLKWNPLN